MEVKISTGKEGFEVIIKGTQEEQKVIWELLSQLILAKQNPREEGTPA